MPGEPHSNGSRFPIGAGGATSAAVQPVRRKAKKTCSPRKAFSAVLSLSLIVKVLGSFNRKPPYCSVSAVVAPLASVCVAVASRMFSPLSFLFFFGGAFNGSSLQLLPRFCHK